MLNLLIIIVIIYCITIFGFIWVFKIDSDYDWREAIMEMDIHPIVYVPILNTIVFIMVGIPYLIDSCRSDS
jgi:hypothetical protein